MRLPSRTLRALSGCLWALATAAVLTACGGDGDTPASSGPGATPPPSGTSVPVGDTVALTVSGQLISFNRATPGALVGSIAVSGLKVNETLLGLDFRPVDGKLYAIGSIGSVYAVDPSTGIATLKAPMGPAIGDNQPFTKLDGSRFAIGFDPVLDRLRIVSDTGQNLHLNVSSGSTVTDLKISGATAAVAAIAHTNALPGAVSTHLYDIDGATGTLYLQAVPNDGTLSAPVALGVDASAVGGFSIDARNNTAYAALPVADGTHLYTVPLVEGIAEGGRAVDVGIIGNGEALLGLALTQPLVVNIVALTADGGTLLLFDAVAPGTFTATLPITGLANGETVLGFDYRPADRRLYGVTSGARIVTLDTTSGAATIVSTLVPDPSAGTVPYAGLEGTRFSVDFDPVADRLRVISDTGAHLRIDVATGAVVTATPIIGVDINGAPFGLSVIATAAHGHSYANATSTTLYDYVADSLNGTSVIDGLSPPDGEARYVAGPSFELAPGAAMDIAGGDDGLVLVAAQIVPNAPWVIFSQQLKINSDYLLYRNPDTENYAASFIGGPQGPAIIDIAIQPL